eukprot:14866564-Alexandrium_andersonii.AAC.1
MRNRLRRSKLELRGSRGVRSAPFFAQMPNLPTTWAGGRAGGASRGGLGGWSLSRPAPPGMRPSLPLQGPLGC